MFKTAYIMAKALTCMIPFIWNQMRRDIKATYIRRQALWFGSTAPEDRDRNIVIVGASFAGYYVARYIALGLPPHSPYRVVVVEPNTHFQFTWVLPRYCVATGHEHKAFVPYGAHIRGAPDGSLRWVRDRVVGVTEKSVRLQDTGEEIPYEYLVIATGSGVDHGLPSRVNETDKRNGMKRLQDMQQGIKDAKRIVVVGGGAAGVEVATDAADMYPDKHIILVHSRSGLMHRFGEGLQAAALAAMQELGAEVILNERVVHEDADAGTVTLSSGRVIECDHFVSLYPGYVQLTSANVSAWQINCTGQKPSSGIISTLSPSSIAPTGHIKIKPTLQIADDALPNVFVCGDVADARTENTNALLAVRQAGIAADNILLAVNGQAPRHTFAPSWLDGTIKLTLGLVCLLVPCFGETPNISSSIVLSCILAMQGRRYSSRARKKTRHSCRPAVGRTLA